MKPCGECTLCCKLFPVDYFNKPAGIHCKNCTEGHGCQIYETRPEVCRTFFCAYAQMEKVSVKFRPDNCGVIFEKLNDTLMFGTGDPDRIEFPKYLNNQISMFTEDGCSVVMLNAKFKEPLIFPAENKTKQEVWKEFQKEAKVRNGCT